MACIASLMHVDVAVLGAETTGLTSLLPSKNESSLAELSRISHDVKKLEDVFDLAVELTEKGAAYEGARLLASIAIVTNDAELRFLALDYLEEWDLTPEEVLRGNKHIVHQKVEASLQQQMLPGNAFGHVRNLFKLNLLVEASSILETACQELNQRPFENKWGILLDEFEISVDTFYVANQQERLELIQQAYTYHHLEDRLPLIWFKNREAWENTSELLQYHQRPLDKESSPRKIGLRRLAYWICLTLCGCSLLTGLVLLMAGIKKSKWIGYGLVGASLIILISAATAYYVKEVYINPDIRPYARWVHDRKSWSEEEEPPPLSLEELVAKVRKHTNQFADKQEWKAAKLLAEVLIFAQDSNADLSQENTLLTEANERIAALKNPFVSEKRPKLDGVESMFEVGKVHHYELELTKEAIQALRDNPKTYVNGTFKYQDKSYPDVGVKLKGGWGSFRIIHGDSKPAFTIKFDAFNKEQRFFGLKRIILNNSVQDSSYLHESAGYSIFRDSGIVAPRTCHAVLKVNDEIYGLYVQVEAATKSYLKRWFEDPDGDLFEGPEGIVEWQELDLDSNQETADRVRIRMLYETLMDADELDPWSTLKDWIDLEAFAQFLATEQFINNWDGYPEANNYRLYDDPTTGKFYFFPHGADQSMEDSRHNMFGRNLEEIVGRALIMTHTGRQAYREAIRGFLDHAWDSEKVLARIRIWYKNIYPYITSGLTQSSEYEFEYNITQLIKFVKSRPFIVRHQLEVDALEADWKNYDEVLPFMEP